MMTVMMTMMVMMVIITDHHHDRLLSVDIVFCGCLCVHSQTMNINSFLCSVCVKVPLYMYHVYCVPVCSC